MLTSTVTTLAPTQVLKIISPATNGAVLPYGSNSTYLVQALFSPTLVSSSTDFNVLINGVLQPATAYILRPTNSTSSNLNNLYYYWSTPPPGTNVIQVSYTNAIVPIGDTRSFIVAPPLKIAGLASNHQLLLWNSVPGVNYQVLATSNLAQPFQPIGTLLPSQGPTTSFYDGNPWTQKFYQILMAQ
jgi:hypothetical protein